MKTSIIQQVAMATMLSMVCLVNQSLSAQSAGKEAGLRATNLTNPNFIYKKQKAENKWVRYRFGMVRFDFENRENSYRIQSGLGFAIGVEKRKQLDTKLYFVHGIEPFIEVNHSFVNSKETENVNHDLSVAPGLGYVLGLQYNFSDRWYVNAETIPNVQTRFTLNHQSSSTTSNQSEHFSVGLEFNTLNLAVSVVHRFNAGE